MLCKYLTEKGDEWPLYVYPMAMAMNTFVSPLTGYSPYEVVFVRTPPNILDVDISVELPTQALSADKYMKLMKERLQTMSEMILKRRIEQQEKQLHREQRRVPEQKTLQKGDFVLFYYEQGSDLNAPSKKLTKPWVGPVVIQAILDDTQYLISDIYGKLPKVVMERNRLKPYRLNPTGMEEISSWQDLAKTLHRLSVKQDIEKEFKAP